MIRIMVVIVADDRLQDLASRLKDDMPKTILIIGTIHNVICGKASAKIYTDNWPDYSAIVCQIFYPKLSEVADLVCYSTSPAALVHVLKDSHLLTWGKKQKIGIESNDADFLINSLPAAQSSLESVFEGFLFYLPAGLLQGKESVCPEGYVLGELVSSNAEFVASHYDYYNDWPTKISWFEGMIRNFSSVAVYTSDNLSMPVAWAMQHPYGEQAHQYTLKEHRRKGLARVVKQTLCRKMVAEGIQPSYEVDVLDPNLESISQMGGEFVNTQCKYKRLVINP